MSARVHALDRKEARRALRDVDNRLRAAHRGQLRELQRERVKIERRQVTLARRAQRIADEYARNQTRLDQLADALRPLLAEVETLRAEQKRLREREERAGDLYRTSVNPRRQQAARRAGRRSAEVRSEWAARYLQSIPEDAPIALAVAMAKKHHWHAMTPDRAAEKFGEWLEIDGKEQALAWQIAKAEKDMKAEIRRHYREAAEAELAAIPF